MEVFRPHRQDSSGWKITFSLGASFLETALREVGIKYINLASRAPNDGMIVSYSHKSGKAFLCF